MPRPLDDTLHFISSWQVGVAVNVVISMAFFIIAALILLPLLRLKHVRSNKVAAAAGVVFLCVAVSRVVRVVRLALPAWASDTSPIALATVNVSATLDLLTATAAITYLVTRRMQRARLADMPLFDDVVHRQEITDIAFARAEQAARASANADRDAYTAMLKAIIKNSQSAIYVKDIRGHYLMVNPRLVEVMGRTEEEVLGETDESIGADHSPFTPENELAAQAGSFRVGEWNDASPGGRRYFDSVKFPLHDENGVLYGTCGVSLDVTEQTRAIEEASVARDEAVEAAASKATFLATMSHEIRTPMNAVIGMTDLLMDTDLDAQQYEFLDTVRTSGEALLAVINDILDFSKIDAGQMHLESMSFNLCDEIESCLDLVVAATTAKQIELICHVDDRCPEHMVGDVVRLRQIVANLLANAVKFTHRGEILVAVVVTPTDTERLALSVSVTDTGIGIPADRLNRLFGSFSQVDASTTRVYGGTGLGLAISQRLAEAMDGRIDVTSELGSGSTFRVTVILDPSPEPPPPPGRADGSVSLAGKSVLLVDDNATNLRILTMQLVGMGMRCTPAESPAVALALAASGLHFDVAIVDMLMPGMNGVELGAALGKLRADVDPPLILLTSMGWRPTKATRTFAAYLTKPVKRVGLRDALEAVLAGRVQDAYPTLTREVIRLQTPPLRILLAEDNPVNQRVAQLILGKLGQQADIVDNGADAVQAVRQAPYDVVLMDIQMPKMDGLEATRQIRAGTGRQPHIVAITAGALPEEREACTAAGMDCFLAKPVRAREVRDLLLQIASMVLPVNTGDSSIAPRSTEDAGDSIAEGADSGSATASAIDVGVLEGLMDDLEDDTGELRETLISSYLDDGEVHVAKLLEAVNEGDMTTAGICAHTLRSTSALMGAVTLATLLQQAEDAARATPADRPAVAEVAATVRGEYERVRTSLSALATKPGQDATALSSRGS